MVSPLVLLGSPLSQKYLELSNISPVKNNFFQRGAIALIENLRIVLFSLEASFLLGVRGTNKSACTVLWGHYAYIYIYTNEIFSWPFQCVPERRAGWQGQSLRSGSQAPDPGPRSVSGAPICRKRGEAHLDSRACA